MTTHRSARRRATTKRQNDMTKTKTAAKKKAAPKKEESPATPERVKVRIEKAGEYDTGTTTWTFAPGKKTTLPLANAKRHAEAGNVTIL